MHWQGITFRKFWLAMTVLALEGQKYVDSLPVTTVPLKADLDIDADPPDRGRIQLPGDAYIDVEQKLPHFRLAYVYRATQVVVLEDGAHVFFTLVPKE